MNGKQHYEKLKPLLNTSEKELLGHYLQFTNNYLTYAAFAEHELPYLFEKSEASATKHAKALIEAGKQIWETKL